MVDFSITGSNGAVHLDEEDQDKVAALDEEISSVEQQIQSFQKLKRDLERQKQAIYQAASASSSGRNVASQNPTKKGTNYADTDFSWSEELVETSKNVFHIKSFRFCQEAVCNAALDSRHCVVIMPTGAGKSLCYQLPAVLSRGLTLVVSPLIALMTDQLFHLKENGIDCELLASSLSKDESNEVMRRLRILGTGGGREGAEEEIKILFVTPERVAKSKTLISLLQKIYDRGHLSRIVIDEAHCVSAMGHDFRPDYKKLSLLRKLMPDTPWMLLTATCGPKVLQDMLSILSLPATTDPKSASKNRSVYFTAPLDRPNLIYSVQSRPTAAKDSAKAIADWITDNGHANDTGIVYCLSRKDSQTMADALKEISEGAIKTGVYHADLDDNLKHSVHVKWRSGKIKVVCATIAFGLGIDKGDVRFVIHSSAAKSLDAFYQETGRAGRDGKESQCVLFYRATDSTRLAGMVASETTGIEKLNDMLGYAQSSECRKVLFNKHFSDSVSNQTQSQKELKKKCGRCDNCTKTSDSSDRDITFEVWKLVKIVEEIYQNEGRITLAALADLARGNGGGKYNVAAEGGGGKRKRQGQASGKSGVIDIQELIGEAVDLSKENVERAIVEAQIAGYLDHDYQQTAYNINVYLVPGAKALRLSRLNLEAAQDQKGLVYLNTIGSEKGKGRKSASKGESKKKIKGDTAKASTSKTKIKDAKKKKSSNFDTDSEMGDWSEEEEDIQEDLIGGFDEDDDEEEEKVVSKKKKKEVKSNSSSKVKNKDWLDEEEEEEEWQVMGGSRKNSYSNEKVGGGSTGSKIKAGNPNAPIEIDSD